MDKDHAGGLLVTVAGLTVLLVAFLVAVYHYGKAGDVSTALAAITGTIGTVIGAYFGVQAGGAAGNKAAQQSDKARAESEASRQKLEVAALHLAAVADPRRAPGVLEGAGLGLSHMPSGEAPRQVAKKPASKRTLPTDGPTREPSA